MQFRKKEKKNGGAGGHFAKMGGGQKKNKTKPKKERVTLQLPLVSSSPVRASLALLSPFLPATCASLPLFSPYRPVPSWPSPLSP